ncbi:MAG: hypothetical protein CSA70_08115 [Rhodobacterales bacterium]|nr:MAG: hypothetical protein CSA70_08115 [Rhodobacterales bacterium]
MSDRVALLVDGENISSALAGKLLIAAQTLGSLVIKRAYGSVARIPGWDAAPGIRLIHSGAGKNSADLLLTVQAMEFAAQARADVFVIASSDGDHSHLATHLREQGFGVVGAGEAKAPESFRRSCTQWIRIEATVQDTETRIYEEMQKHPGGLLIGGVNAAIRNALAVTLSDLAEPSWRKYFEARPQSYQISGEAQQTRIRAI